MDLFNRRDFMKRTAGTLAAAAALQPSLSLAEAYAAPMTAATAQRTLGKSGLTCTRLGIGTGTRAWNKNSEQIRQGRETFLKTLTHAYEQGVRYYDLSDSYPRAAPKPQRTCARTWTVCAKRLTPIILMSYYCIA